MKKKIIYLNYFWIVTLLMSGYVVSLKGTQPESSWTEENEKQISIKNSFKIEPLVKHLSNINNIAYFSFPNSKNIKKNLDKENSDNYPNYDLPYLNSSELTSKDIEFFNNQYGKEQLFSELLALNEFALIGDLIYKSNVDTTNHDVNDENEDMSIQNQIDFINSQLQGNENILKYNFELTEKLFFLYFKTSDIDKVEEIYNILINFHNKKITKSPLCFEFYRLQLSKDVSFESLKAIIDDCLANGKNKKLIYEYITYLLAEKGIVTAQQEYELYYKQYDKLKPPYYFFKTL
ncbi:MAG: hypothetical protein HQK51_17065 [Oligoflexia bacterium]|nr:hypothetical protein [Oligoflexia bacterium]